MPEKEPGAGPADQNEGTGADLEKKDGAGNDGEGEHDDAGFEKKFKDQQGRAAKFEGEAKSYKQRLIDNGFDPDTGKPKENKRAPKKDADSSDERFTTLEQRTANAETRATKAELRSMGITHADDLKLVMNAAKELGIDPTEAAERPYIKAEMETQREHRRTDDATPPPKKGGGPSKGSGKLPDFSKMSDKEFDEWERKNRR